MRRALIPGSFDPVTLGHLNIICRAAGNYDEVVVGIFENPEKHYLFTLEQRAALLRTATQNHANVRVVACDGYTADYAKEGGFAAIVRGYRSDSDLTYEQKMAQYNSGRGGVHTLFCLCKDHTFDTQRQCFCIHAFGGYFEIICANLQ